MITANIKELKKRLNHYLRFAEHGKVVVITRRGHAIAEVHPPRTALEGKRSVEAVMLALSEQGIVDLPARTGKIGLDPPLKVRDPGGAMEILDRLIEERKRR